MKLATIRVPDATTPAERRDGRLVVVDAQEARVALVPDAVAPTMHAAIQDWARAEPGLRDIDGKLRSGEWPDTRPLEDCDFMAPLPRTTCWIDGSAFIQHIILVRKARGAEPPEDLRDVPLMYQGVGDPLLGPHDPVEVADEAYGIDFEAEVGVVLDDVPMGVTAAAAERHIKLLCIMNDVSLRNLIPRELKAGFGFFQGKPPSSFAPWFVTPDEVGKAWRGGRLHLEVVTRLNGQPFGHPDAGEMFFPFPRLIEHAAKTRPLPAGTILGSGTVSNEDASVGSSCLAERRMLEIIADGEASTPFLRFGDRVEVEVLQDGRNVFGTIDQTIVRFRGPA